MILTVMEQAISRYIVAHPGLLPFDLAAVFHVKEEVINNAVMKIHQVLMKLDMDEMGRIFVKEV
jgi:hypothetical protein